MGAHMQPPEPQLEFLRVAAGQVKGARRLVSICVEQGEGGVRQIWQRVAPEVFCCLTRHHLSLSQPRFGFWCILCSTNLGVLTQLSCLASFYDQGEFILCGTANSRPTLTTSFEIGT